MVFYGIDQQQVYQAEEVSVGAKKL